VAIGMAEHSGQAIDVVLEALLAGSRGGRYDRRQPFQVILFITQ
jgi:hypothetical protein